MNTLCSDAKQQGETGVASSSSIGLHDQAAGGRDPLLQLRGALPIGCKTGCGNSQGEQD